MEYVKIKAIEESDFDAIVFAAGGKRISEEGSADYAFREAIIELKLIKEEGFEKDERQRKLAEFFRRSQPDSSVVSINPRHLTEAGLRQYRHIVETPIKNACKKASKQLQRTATRIMPPPVRVLVIVNVGYTLLMQDEFREICFERVTRDTGGIDWVFCGGIYFHSDAWDNYVLAPFEDFAVNVSCSFPSRDLLAKAWGDFLDRIMTDAIRNPETIEPSRMPVMDLSFELDGVRYVKAAPAMPKSSFWPEGVAPRTNSREAERLPPVARVFPSLSEGEWGRFKQAMPTEARLKATFKEWRGSYPSEPPDFSASSRLFVHFDVKYEGFPAWAKKPESGWSFADVALFATHCFNQEGLSILESARDRQETLIVPLEYLHLVVDEIGTDEANDIVALYHVSELPGFEKKEPIFENVNLFFRHGMALAAAHAVKRGVDALYYTKRKMR